MSEVEDFLSSEDEAEVIQAIREAEKTTSGEIRVHLEYGVGKASMERAKEVFHMLKMDNTKEENGVLIYLAVHEHHFAIIGDRGIDRVVPPGFWDSTRDIMQDHFRHKRFKKGLVEGILKAGEQLQKHFPWHHEDKNELPDDISRS
ncbi:TPM domain-containing protein [Robertkochia aurantiaca]|uniref:TPM domain-containing protein n=1 Tax=Robertkochia aurantiaca TaxID=2873700 RepID=UPI001CCD2319|nr:TPM domain-containing protein [Robertkochia sp. 3YJGBD-33]